MTINNSNKRIIPEKRGKLAAGTLTAGRQQMKHGEERPLFSTGIGLGPKKHSIIYYGENGHDLIVLFTEPGSDWPRKFDISLCWKEKRENVLCFNL